MASTHHLVRVCMFCLLCAAHSWCAAHIGSIDNAQNIGKFQELRHERFKDTNPGRGREHPQEYGKDPFHENIKNIYDRPGTYSIPADYQTLRKPKNRYSGGTSEDNKLSGDVENTKPGVNYARVDGLDLVSSQNNYKVQSGSARHSADSSRLNSLGADVDSASSIRNDLRLSGSEANHQSKLSDKNSRLSGDAAYTNRRSKRSAQLPLSKNKHLDRPDRRIRKRDAHIPDVEANKLKSDGVAGADEPQYKVKVKNIDVEFYIKKLFTQFGDRESMTMNLTGFEQMLRKLDLDRMIPEIRGMQPVSSGNFQAHPVEQVLNGVRSNSTNVTCVNSVDLVSSLNEKLHQHSPSRGEHHHGHVDTEVAHTAANMSLLALKSNIHLNARILTRVCPILLYQKVAQTSYERQGCIVERDFPKSNGIDLDSTELFPYSEFKNGDNEDEFVNDTDFSEGANNRTAVWTYSCLCILAISACGLLGVAVIPIMHHTYYQQILQFLVALAVGTLSGDAMLHLLPHAMASHSHSKHSHNSADEEHAHNDSMWKGLVAMVGVVFFYFTEKGFNLIAEWRKRRMRRDKENKLPTRVRVMRNDIGCLKGSGSCSSKTGSSGFLKLPNAINLLKPGSNKQGGDANNAVQNSKICKHKYSEYPYCYDEIATDTHDDHHVRDGKQGNSTKEVKAVNENHKDSKNDDASLSVVSSNNLEEAAPNKQEPTANDSLLSGDSNKGAQKGIISNNRLQPQDYAAKEEFFIKRGLDIDNGGKKRIGVRTVDGHTRSRSADRATELEDLEPSKRANQEESYTVILREHSQTHHGHSHSHGHVHSPPSSLSSVVWMVIMGDGLHNFTDGMAIGAAFSSNIAGGFSTAIAVLCHELPHEIGDFAVLLKAGMSAKRAVCYNLLSSILCLLGMVVGVVAGHAPEATAWIFAAAAGMFMYIALVDMIPELSSSHSNEGSICQCILQLLGLSTGIGIMLLIAMYEHDLKKLFG